jgi:hypothetical protein
MLHHELLPEQALFGRISMTAAVLKLNQFDTKVAAARFQQNFKQSGGRLGGNVAHDGSDRPDAKIGTKAHVMQYQIDYWDMEYERATSYLLGARAAATAAPRQGPHGRCATSSPSGSSSTSSTTAPPPSRSR